MNSAARSNPFPGMNPFMEQSWGDVHTKLLGRLADELQSHLPGDLLVRAEERIEMQEGWDELGGRSFQADVSISELPGSSRDSSWKSNIESGDLLVAEPEYEAIAEWEETSRWLEVRTTKGYVVTVIELLSPVNKAAKRSEFIERRRALIEAGANFVEIDLLRGGRAVCMGHYLRERPYSVAVYRASERQRVEMYRVGLRERLPAFRVPLRVRDADVAVELQPLLNRCYEAGRYWQADYALPLIPSLSAEDSEWVQSIIHGAGLDLPHEQR